MFKKIWQKSDELLERFLCRIHLPKLRVFFQIQILTLFMVFILIGQSYYNLKGIETMQQSNYVSFIQSNNLFNQISGIKLILQKIETDYLLANSENKSVPLPDDLEARTEYFMEISPDNYEGLQKTLKKIRDITKLPPDYANFARLRQQVKNASNYTDGIHKVLMNSINTVYAKNTKYVDSAKRQSYLAVFFCIIFAALFGLIVSASISRPLKKVLQATKALAVGDLTPKISVTGCPEVVKMVDGLNQAINGIKNLVHRINEQSEALLHAGNELKQASLDTGTSASQVAQTMEELARATSEQTNQINQAVETVNTLTNLVTQVSSENNNIALSSQQLVESAKLGQKTTGLVVEEINELYNTATEAATVIQELAHASGKIKEITALIEGISEQTGLLSLNAAIEAARAGEYGRGFAVVAQETSKLGEQTMNAVSLIENLITQMNARTEQAITVMKLGIERTESGKKLINDANTTFEKIFANLMENLKQIDLVAKSAKKMAEMNQNAINSINTIAAISEESMASTEEVSATTEEQSASVEEVTALAENLTTIAAGMQNAVAVFKLE